VGALLLGALLGLAVLAERLSPQDPITQDRHASWAAPNRFHPMGTDPLGRDVLARVAHAARTGLIASAPGALLAALTALLAVHAAGRVPRRWRRLAQGALERFTLVPSLAVALIAAQFLHCDSPASLSLLMGFTTWGPLARRGLQPVSPEGRSLVPPALSHAGWLLVIESVLSSLGLGLAAPSPSWGSMVREGLGNPVGGWWAWLFPGAALAMAAAAFRLVGDGAGLRSPSLFSRHE
jgi:peptide/nickel transport system permease protein